ncbi:unnamed protein product [Cyclocybe aegerita]|uniref:Uncharacterized protein n=1 Tax=Cyclocybe aegerita TaxID=1973307 RepID=A0A8S0VXT7_CYCAE|nr:unnamed protein product [Cyclocybe aegerita]
MSGATIVTSWFEIGGTASGLHRQVTMVDVCISGQPTGVDESGDVARLAMSFIADAKLDTTHPPLATLSFLPDSRCNYNIQHPKANITPAPPAERSIESYCPSSIDEPPYDPSITT